MNTNNAKHFFFEKNKTDQPWFLFQTIEPNLFLLYPYPYVYTLSPLLKDGSTIFTQSDHNFAYLIEKSKTYSHIKCGKILSRIYKNIAYNRRLNPRNTYI